MMGTLMLSNVNSPKTTQKLNRNMMNIPNKLQPEYLHIGAIARWIKFGVMGNRLENILSSTLIPWRFFHIYPGAPKSKFPKK